MLTPYEPVYLCRCAYSDKSKCSVPVGLPNMTLLVMLFGDGLWGKLVTEIEFLSLKLSWGVVQLEGHYRLLWTSSSHPRCQTLQYLCPEIFPANPKGCYTCDQDKSMPSGYFVVLPVSTGDLLCPPGILGLLQSQLFSARVLLSQLPQLIAQKSNALPGVVTPGASQSAFSSHRVLYETDLFNF